MDKFNTKFPRNIDLAQVKNPAAKRVSDDSSSDHISAIHVHSPSLPNTTIDSTVTPSSIDNAVLLMPNRSAPAPTSDGWNYLYSSDSEDNPVFEEMVDSNYIIKPINTYTIAPPNLTLVITPPKVLKKNRKIIGRTRLATIKQAQSDKTASARFLSIALHSVSQVITRANSHRIAVYNKKDTAYCADSGASEDMFPDYSTCKTYHRLNNLCAALGDTTKLHIEGIGTSVYTLNGRTILNRDDLHIPELRGPLYSLRKHRQQSGCGFYFSYKDGSYLFFPDSILQVEDSYDNIVSYRSLSASYKGPIDYIEPKTKSSNNMATPSGQTSTITPEPKPQSPHIIPSYDESISS